MNEKLKIVEDVYADSCFSGCYILSDFITVANRLIEMYGDVNVRLDAGYNSVETILEIEREETNEEFARRTTREEMNKITRRKTYEKLKKEFE